MSDKTKGEFKRRIIDRPVTFHSNMRMIRRHQEQDEKLKRGPTPYLVIDLESFTKQRMKDSNVLDEAKADFPNIERLLEEGDTNFDIIKSCQRWRDKWFGAP